MLLEFKKLHAIQLILVTHQQMVIIIIDRNSGNQADGCATIKMHWQLSDVISNVYTILLNQARLVS